MKKLSLITLLILFLGTINAQTIKGVLTDSTNTKIAMGNIVELSPKDSSIVGGTYFMDGAIDYKLKNEMSVVKFTSMGYADKYISPVFSNGVYDFGTEVLIFNNTLSEVNVVASIPMFEQKENGSVVVNVENTMLASSSNAKEILGKSPNVSINEQGIEVIGKGEALLYLNGKQVPLDRMSSLPVELIKQIEIISNPNAKYDAEGNAVVNIILKEKQLQGHQVDIIQHITKGLGALTYTSLAYSFNKNKLSLIADYNINMGTTGRRDNIKTTVTEIENPYVSNTDLTETTMLNNVSNYVFGGNYKFNEKHELSFEYNGNYSHYSMDTRNNNELDYKTSKESIYTRNDANWIGIDNNASVNYYGNLDTLGSNIFVGTQYSSFSRDIADDIVESNNEDFSDNILNTDIFTDNRYDIAAAQTDIQKYFKNNSLFEFGGKYSAVTNNAKNELVSESLADSPIENNINYNEAIAAGYTQYSSSIKKVNYTIGLRFENTNAKGFSSTTNSTYIDTTYTNFFPSFNIETPIKKVRITHSLSSRINRPNYGQLNPFTLYLNKNMMIKGNAKLTPAYVYSYETKIGVKRYDLTIGVSQTNNAIRFINSYSNAYNAITAQANNIKRVYSTYSNLNIPFEYKSFRSYNSINITLEKLDDNTLDIHYHKVTPKGYFYTYNEYSVKDFMSLELSGEYTSANSNGFYKEAAVGSITLGASKRFLNNKIFIRFVANDIFLQAVSNTNMNVSNINLDHQLREDTRFYRMFVKYSFGSAKGFAYKNKGVNRTEQNRAG